MEAQFFNHLQSVVCIDSKGEFDDDSPLDLIEGKKYTVNIPYGRGITLIGHWSNRYDQNRFITVEENEEIESEIFEMQK